MTVEGVRGGLIGLQRLKDETGGDWWESCCVVIGGHEEKIEWMETRRKETPEEGRVREKSSKRRIRKLKRGPDIKGIPL